MSPHVTPIQCHPMSPRPPFRPCCCAPPAVFNVLLVAALKNMAALLDRHLAPQGKRPSKRPDLRSTVRQYLRDLVVVSGRSWGCSQADV